VKGLMETGAPPPGVEAAHQRVRSASIVLPPDQAYKDGAREALLAQPGVAPASV
jgi:phthalate 4,5-dioxygenase oxygenase subunit